MPTSLPSTFAPGQVFRTRELAAWTANPTRTIKRWVDRGLCTRLRPGLYTIPATTRFGVAQPDRMALMRTFLEGDAYVFTGPPAWNTLGLGATQLFAHPLVYNRKRSGRFDLGGRTFELRRTRFPDQPSMEWFVIDLLQNLEAAGLDRTETTQALSARVAEGRFDPERLTEVAAEYGTRATQSLVRTALGRVR